jgi:CheY-like chemotaxis protein
VANLLGLSNQARPLQWFPGKARAGLDTPETYNEDELDLTFEVEDTGKGISEDEMGKLFNRFMQANPKTHVQYGGSGLGLFISRELVELHGGMIGAKSRPGQGSTFAFYLKVRTAQLGDIAAVQKANVDSDREQVYFRRSTPTRSQNQIQIRPKRASSSKIEPGLARRRGALSLLLVEDNVVNQQVLSRQLRRSGYTVQIANHGGEALEFLKSTKYWKGDPPAAGDHVVTSRTGKCQSWTD